MRERATQDADAAAPVSVPDPDRTKPIEGAGTLASPPRARWALPVLAVLVFGIYLITLWSIDLAGLPNERHFDQAPDATGHLKIYLEPLSVDPVSAALLVRVDLNPVGDLTGSLPDAPNRDLSLVLSTSDSTEEHVFRANEPISSMTLRLSLAEGSITQYPLDRYYLPIQLRAFENDAAGVNRPIAENITVWEGTLGYAMRARQAGENTLGDVGLRIDIARPAAHIIFALAAYAAMMVLACCSLAISVLVFAGVRKPEPTLIGALAALVFALPAFRNALPGAPPLGIMADIAVFFWAELAAVIGIALLVHSWALQDRRKDDSNRAPEKNG